MLSAWSLLVFTLLLPAARPQAQMAKFRAAAKTLVEAAAADKPRHRVEVTAEWRGGYGGVGLAPAQMDPALEAHVAAAAERALPGGWMRMPSGAGHDAQTIAQV